MSKAITATPETINDLANEGIVIVDFMADWCQPCQQMLRVADELAERVADKARVVKVDIDKHPEFTAKYKVRGIPTFIAMKDGVVLGTSLGVKPLSTLLKLVEPELGAL